MIWFEIFSFDFRANQAISTNDFKSSQITENDSIRFNKLFQIQSHEHTFFIDLKRYKLQVSKVSSFTDFWWCIKIFLAAFNGPI